MHLTEHLCRDAISIHRFDDCSGVFICACKRFVEIKALSGISALDCDSSSALDIGTRAYDVNSRQF